MHYLDRLKSADAGKKDQYYPGVKDEDYGQQMSNSVSPGPWCMAGSEFDAVFTALEYAQKLGILPQLVN